MQGVLNLPIVVVELSIIKRLLVFFCILIESQSIEEDKSVLAMHEHSGRTMLKRLRINKLVGKFIQGLFLIYVTGSEISHLPRTV